MNNPILDYEQVQDKLKQLIKNGKIIKQINIGNSKYGLPIEHYTIGNGEKEIVITGAAHGSEIISTDFVLQLMEELQKDDGAFKNIDLNNYTFHFVPILNPEGYLITTSAIRQLIPRDMSREEAERICKQYYLAYRQDDIDANTRKKEGLEPDRTSIKHHQKFFKGIDWTCIPDKYPELKKHIKEIYDNYPDLPKNTLHIWSANGDGIDIQANSKYNSKLEQILNGQKIYADNFRYNNIDITHPGPINAPFDQQVGFEETNELIAISNLLETLHNKGTLSAYFNYHSTGGLIYQRPDEPPANLGISTDSILEKTIRNFVCAKIYSKGTYKNSDDKEGSQYKILTGNGKANTSNDIFRLLYPADILVELSGMGGNPIGPYGDLNNNYKNLIQSNIQAFHGFLLNNDLITKISQATYEVFKNSIKNGVSENIVQDIYTMVNASIDKFFEVSNNKLSEKNKEKSPNKNEER